MDSTASIIIICCLVVVGIIVAIYCILRNKKINENGIEADAVISRIDTNYDSEGSPSQVYFVDYVNAEGNTVTAKLGNPPMNAFQVMLMAFASCEEEKKDNEENSLVKGIFESTIASREYLKWKAEWKGSGTTITEKLDGDSIIFKAESTEAKGEFTFKLDGDYLVYTPDDKDETGAGGYAFSLMIIQGVSDYYDMDYSDVTGYLAGVANLDMENKYLINDTETSAVKVYVAEKWDLSELDEMYINEKALEYTDPLNEEFSNKILNCGRMTMLAYGDVNNVQIIFIEKGEKSSDITYKSIMSAVTKLQPKGYKTFAKKYTELKDAKGKGYKVVLGLDKDIAAEHELTAEEGRSYVTVVFNASKK